MRKHFYFNPSTLTYTHSSQMRKMKEPVVSDYVCEREKESVSESGEGERNREGEEIEKKNTSFNRLSRDEFVIVEERLPHF